MVLRNSVKSVMTRQQQLHGVGYTTNLPGSDQRSLVCGIEAEAEELKGAVD